MGKIVYIDSHRAGGGPELYEKMRADFEKAGHTFHKEACPTKEDVMAATKDAIAIITAHTPIDKGIIDNAQNLKVIVRSAIGYEILDVSAATAKGIPACNVPDYCTEEVANHTFALLLACARKLKPGARVVERGEWKARVAYPIHRLSGQTLGLIGFGRISRIIAKHAQGFGLTVLAYDPFVTADVCKDLGAEKVELDDLYARADYICLNVPLTKDNYHMINTDSIAKMKDGVMIINAGRGALVSTEDLVAGLESGKVRAAGLDVLEEEPLTDTSAKILSFETVIVTPHIAFDSEEGMGDNYQKTTDTVLKVLGGELPFNVLNKEALTK